MSNKKCSVNGCNQVVHAKNMCNKHYRRFMKWGDPSIKKTTRKNPLFCIIDGCNKPAHARGLCDMHQKRLERKGDANSKVRHWGSDLIKKYPYEYNTWKRMRNRCNNPNSPDYKDYGGRGIYVCERWMGEDGPINFIKDMGPRPKEKCSSGVTEYSIDRIDNDGPYSPENCRWATKREQALNRRPKAN